MIEQLDPDRTLLLGQFLHLVPAMAQLQARGIDHFGEEQRIRGPSPDQTSEDAVADSCQRGLQNTAVQLTRRATSWKLEWI